MCSSGQGGSHPWLGSCWSIQGWMCTRRHHHPRLCWRSPRLSLDARVPHGRDGAGQSPLGRVLAAAPRTPAWGLPSPGLPPTQAGRGQKTLCWVVMLRQHLGFLIRGREVIYKGSDPIRCCGRGVLCCLESSWVTTMAFLKPGAGCAEEPSELLMGWGLRSLLGLSLTAGLVFSLRFLAKELP